MKIAITYLPEEERLAGLILHFAQGLAPGAKTRKSSRHTPYQHVYLATKKPETPCGPEGNT